MYAGIVGFTFKKKNGELREMKATLVTSQIQSNQLKEENPNPPNSDKNLIVCWDIDASGWRSFNVDTLTEYSGIIRKV